MPKIVLHTGSHLHATHHIKVPLKVITQGVETSDELVEEGRHIKSILKEQTQDLHLFTNNDHFLNGLRLALVEGELLPEELEVVFYRGGHKPEYVKFDADGYADTWPRGFFDSIEKALAELALLQGVKARARSGQ